MKHNIVVPSAGESVTEVFIGKWRKQSGDVVKKGDVLVDLESQKATFELESDHDGRLEILFPKTGDKVNIGEIIANIDDSDNKSSPSPQPSPQRGEGGNATKPAISPSVREILTEKNLAASEVQGSGKNGRILKEDVLKSAPAPVEAGSKPTQPAITQPATVTKIVNDARGQRREPATRLRQQIAKNLVAAQHTAAILTTFNEIDMTQILDFRKKHKETFQKKYGVGLGMVGFFALAAVRALKTFPLVNANFTGEEIVYNDFIDLSVAVSTERGLVVPVMRDLQNMDLVGFEKALSALSEKARVGKLSIPDMTGGTFTISNGGVFGSLLSTPILNMPQSAILGLHKTEKRAVVVDDQIVIRPMMYMALSYDHRIIDGKEAVQFLVSIKEAIENLSLIVDEKTI